MSRRAHAGAGGGPGRPLRVLESFREPRPTTNPYVRLLLRALRDHGLDVATFTWPRALLGRYDVLHLHWPEVAVRGGSPLRTRARQLLGSLLVARLAVQRRRGRAVVVRTVHNLDTHERGDRVERELLRALVALTDGSVHLNHLTALEQPWASRPLRLALLGHYREWYSPASASPVPGRVLHFGVIRPYKNVEQVVAAAEAAPDGVAVRIAGSPTTPELRELVEDAQRRGAVSAALGHLPDDALTEEVAQAEVVVLPYVASHNSSAALAALSLDRPVLVPRTEVTEALAQEVGPGWVTTYTEPLTAAHLAAAVADARRPRAEHPDLSQREWDGAARRHAEMFEELLAARSASRRRARSARTQSA